MSVSEAGVKVRYIHKRVLPPPPPEKSSTLATMFSRSLPVLRRSFKELPIPRNRTSIPLLSTRVTPAFTYRILRHYSTPSVLPPPIDIPVTSSSEQAQPVKLLSIEPRFSMTMTCTVTDCGTRSTHEFTKRAYTKGLVIIQCPGCKNR